MKPPALIDNGNNLSAKIDNPFQEFRRIGNASNPIRDARDLFDRFNWKSKLLIAQFEDKKLLSLGDALGILS